MTVYNILHFIFFSKNKLFAKKLSQFFVIHMISCFSCSIGLIKYPDYPNTMMNPYTMKVL